MHRNLSVWVPLRSRGVRGGTSSEPCFLRDGWGASARSPLIPSLVCRSPAVPRHFVPRRAGGLAPLHHLQPEGTIPGQEPGAGGGTSGGEGGQRGLQDLQSGAGCFNDLRGIYYQHNAVSATASERKIYSAVSRTKASPGPSVLLQFKDRSESLLPCTCAWPSGAAFGGAL